MPAPDLRLGVDVGGTNTDAVVLDVDDRLIAKAKVPTTVDVTPGIDAAIAAVARDVERERITHAMFGTTHATNAVLERRGLRRVGVLRLGGPATHAIRPLFGWPADLREVVSAGERIVDGGIEFDGRDLSPLDEDAVARFAGEIADAAEAVAIASVFAPVSDRHERRAEEIVRKELGDVPISCSADIGSVGLLERENATVLNAALVDVARDVAGAVRDALDRHGLRPVTFFAQNDGTLMDLDFAIRFPVLTIGSGPANSIRGAAYLTGRVDAIVVDVGGTSTDIGVLVHGFPRESSFGVEVGGIHTNFRMPDLVTIALGGGTIVHADGIGPRSVGYRLVEDALVFGGATPTLTDAAVATGRLSLGDGAAVAPHRERLAAAVATADEMLADAVDRVKTSRDPVPLVAVGGGAPLVPDGIAGASEVLRPHDSDVANAIGAAIASVSGEVDRIFHLGQGGRETAVADASAEAIDRAVSAGAARDRVEIVEIEEVPLAYLTDPAVRIRVKAAGPIAWG
jgi:N-methylhydantoinase A/oxoprolinase/acetone carboxylase beta subunit